MRDKFNRLYTNRLTREISPIHFANAYSELLNALAGGMSV